MQVYPKKKKKNNNNKSSNSNNIMTQTALWVSIKIYDNWKPFHMLNFFIIHDVGNWIHLWYFQSQIVLKCASAVQLKYIYPFTLYFPAE